MRRNEVIRHFEDYKSNQRKLVALDRELRGYYKLLDEVFYVGKKPCGIPSELADIVIRVLDTCVFYGIDIGKVIIQKHEYNKSRPYRHGGKVL